MATPGTEMETHHQGINVERLRATIPDPLEDLFPHRPTNLTRIQIQEVHLEQQPKIKVEFEIKTEPLQGIAQSTTTMTTLKPNDKGQPGQVKVNETDNKDKDGLKIPIPPPPKVGPIKMRSTQFRYSPYDNYKMNPNAKPFVSRHESTPAPPPPVGPPKPFVVDMKMFDDIFGKPVFPVNFEPVGVKKPEPETGPPKPSLASSGLLFNPLSAKKKATANPTQASGKESTGPNASATFPPRRPKSPSLLENCPNPED